MKHSLVKWVGFFVCLLVTCCNANGQKSNVDEYMAGLIKDKQLSGASVVVLKGDRVFFSNNYGYADISKQEAVTDRTQFGIMSITKTFVACAVMQLFDKKVINLDESIRKYLEKLPAQYDRVSVAQLLNHSSGVPDYVELPGYMAQANKTQTPWQVLQPILDKPLAFKPGSKSAYSNSGYFLLGMMIEKVTGGSLGDYLKKNIFIPAGMLDTFLDENIRKGKSRTKGYMVGNNDFIEASPLDPSQYWAAGGIVTTKADLLNWNAALKKGIILPAKEISQMMQPTKLTDGSTSEYGLGFELMNAPDMKIAGSAGTGVGFNAAYLQFLSDGLTVIVLTNTSGSNSTMIAKTIRDMMVKQAANAPAPASASRDELDSAVVQLFIDAGKGAVNDGLFKDADALTKFKNETLSFIQSQGGFKALEQKGERKNPESIARKYQVTFEKGVTSWIFIFSSDEKIMIINHM